MTDYWKCPECGHLNESSLKFCEECGTSKDVIIEKVSKQKKQRIIEEKMNFCPFCGKKIRFDEIKCPHCGADLTVSSVETNTKVDVIMKPEKVTYLSSLKFAFLSVGISFPLVIVITSLMYFFATMLYLGSTVVGTITYFLTLIVIGLGFSVITYFVTYVLVRELFIGTTTMVPDFFFEFKTHIKLAFPFVLLTIFFLGFNSKIFILLSMISGLIAMFFPMIHISRLYIEKLKELYVYPAEKTKE